ncbi:MAG: hypothetical protein KatS3mg087_0113 [Patescibacteria group bacterium]|nr:MAG: hypothetical protein KatS3mg087_0113 [Patescibacteria group bacterium]
MDDLKKDKINTIILLLKQWAQLNGFPYTLEEILNYMESLSTCTHEELDAVLDWCRKRLFKQSSN